MVLWQLQLAELHGSNWQGSRAHGGQNTRQCGCRAVQAGEALSWGSQQLKFSPQNHSTASSSAVLGHCQLAGGCVLSGCQVLGRPRAGAVVGR